MRAAQEGGVQQPRRRQVVDEAAAPGQQARLRGADGINFTTAGKRKLAFYVEKYARRHLGEVASPELVTLDATNLPELVLPPSPTASVPVQPISMLDPELDGGTELLGAAAPPPPTAREATRRLCSPSW